MARPKTPPALCYTRARMIQRLDSDRPRRAPRMKPAAAGPWLLLFAVSFALRFAYVWLSQGPDAAPSSDALQLDTIAWNLARGAGFSLDAAAGSYPTASVPPVVPWLTSLVYRIAGHQYLAGLALQCALGACTPLLVVGLGTMLFGSPAGWTAGWLAAFDPMLVFFSGYLLTEAPFTTFQLLALLASVAWVRTPQPGRALGAGMLWGIAALTRPTALLVPGLIAAWAWVPLGLTLATRDRVRQIVLLLVGVVLIMAPWSVRNSLVSGRFVPVKTGAGRTFLDSNNPVLWADPARRGGANDSYAIERYATLYRGRTEAEIDSIASREAWTFLNAHRDEWPAMAAAKVARFWRIRSEAGSTGTWQGGGSSLTRMLRVVDPVLLWSLLTLPFALWGSALLLAGARRWFQSVVLLLIVFTTVLAIPYWGALRLRVPIEPLVLILAAAGFEDLRRRLRRRGHGLTVIEGVRRA